MKKDVLLIANYWHFFFEKKSSRYRTMADTLVKHGFDVEIITSSFRHQTKSQRNLEQIRAMEFPYKVTMLREPSYRKNISLKRIWSHHVFSGQVVRYLKQRKRPDVIVVSVPSLAVGSAVTKFAQKRNIPVVVDIQDLWPEAFKMAIDIPVVSDILFAPMMLQANRIYARADKIMAVSETYMERGLSCNRKDPEGLAVYIGTDAALVKESVEGKVIRKPREEFWIGYAGALGHSYDIRLIMDALEILREKGICNIVLKIMGEGALMTDFQAYARKKSVQCEFLGFMEYGDMMRLLMECDVAVNPIVGKSVSSVINKVSDYAIAGVPVINTQNSPEYRSLIEEYHCGINCENGDPQSVANAVMTLYGNEPLKEQMRNNSLRLAKEKFDRASTYQSIAALLDNMEQ